MAILRAFILGAVIAACFAAPVYAQRKGAPIARTVEDRDKEKNAEAVDRQYKATLERTRKDPAQAAPKDPWATLRGDDSNAKR